MPRYDVTLYRPMRQGYYGIMAPDPQAAIAIAEKLPPAPAEDCEALAVEALVDELDENGNTVDSNFHDLDPDGFRDALRQFVDAWGAPDLLKRAHALAVKILSAGTYDEGGTEPIPHVIARDFDRSAVDTTSSIAAGDVIPPGVPNVFMTARSVWWYGDGPDDNRKLTGPFRTKRDALGAMALARAAVTNERAKPVKPTRAKRRAHRRSKGAQPNASPRRRVRRQP